MAHLTARRRISTVAEGGTRSWIDHLITEEPLEIRLDGRALAVTMRTPGDDFELAAGFLVSEGVVTRRDDIATIRYCAGATEEGLNTYNVLDVTLAPGVPVPEMSLERNFYTTSSCGVCGKTSLDAVRTKAAWRVEDEDLVLEPGSLAELPDRLRAAQGLFERTGGLHGAGLFSADGDLRWVREDVGRHNAVDKLVGRAILDDALPLRNHILLVSGRASFELVQKVVMAGIPAMAAVSAPSSLAADLAEEEGVTLVGFLRGTSMNVYTGSHRVRSGV
ncbi:MAG: formate dehydrogenase accessory sulfurtransferase FdhD [Propionibacteriales bacterium]|nr:formate dehydrogenase accessory sulfurtransferase FdhD [Propionibacteriales bacterium]